MVSIKVRNNFALYLRCYKEFGAGSFNPWQKTCALDEAGSTALECFGALENRGKTLPCSEPELFVRAQTGKELLNFNIQQWAEGINRGLFCIGEFQEDFYWLPNWTWKAVEGQLTTKRKGWEFPWHTKLLQAELESRKTEKEKRMMLCSVCGVERTGEPTGTRVSVKAAVPGYAFTCSLCDCNPGGPPGDPRKLFKTAIRLIESAGRDCTDGNGKREGEVDENPNRD